MCDTKYSHNAGTSTLVRADSVESPLYAVHMTAHACHMAGTLACEGLFCQLVLLVLILGFPASELIAILAVPLRRSTGDAMQVHW